MPTLRLLLLQLPPPPPSPPPSLLLPLPLLLLLLLLLPLSGPSRCHLMAHGSSLIGHTSANNVLTVRTYCHMAGGENITREPKPKSVSKHFVLHVKHKKLETLLQYHFCRNSVHIYSEALSSVGFIPTVFTALQASPLHASGSDFLRRWHRKYPIALASR